VITDSTMRSYRNRRATKSKNLFYRHRQNSDIRWVGRVSTAGDAASIITAPASNCLRDSAMA
jgi:hypothetical protein